MNKRAWVEIQTGPVIWDKKEPFSWAVNLCVRTKAILII
jgi:hypothetical protein